MTIMRHQRSQNEIQQRNKTLYAIISNIPVRFHRMMISFSETINKGKVVWRLSIMRIISPQICTREHMRGTTDRKVTITKIMLTRRSERKLSLVVLSISGHKPISSKLTRCSSIAHTKSNRILLCNN